MFRAVAGDFRQWVGTTAPFSVVSVTFKYLSQADGIGCDCLRALIYNHHNTASSHQGKNNQRTELSCAEFSSCSQPRGALILVLSHILVREGNEVEFVFLCVCVGGGVNQQS